MFEALSAVLWRTSTLLVLAFLGWNPVQAQPFEARLVALGIAVDKYLAGADGGGPAPMELRKLLWLNLAGDRLPDALVVLRSRRDECAAIARTQRQPCRAVIFSGLPDGSFRLVSEFSIRSHPVLLRVSTEGVREVYYSRESGENPQFGRYSFNGENFSRVDGDSTLAQLNSLPVLQADDRSMSSWADQAYAGQHFANTGIRLAPVRMHFDALAVPSRRLLNARSDALYGEGHYKSGTYVEKLLPDAIELGRALGWPHTLELRLWACLDWMVERRFWEVEDSRLGRPGACIEPALFALKQGIVKSEEAMLDVLRVQLLQQVGVAWALRVSTLPASDRQALRSAEGIESTRITGAIAGQFIGHQRRLISLDRSDAAISALQQVASAWFERYEQRLHHRVTPTAELRDFFLSSAISAQATSCLQRVLAIPQKPASNRRECSASQLERTRQIVALLREDMKP
jgi:hypothetical protein